jgi:elongation factor P
MATTADISVGMFIRFNNELCQVTEWQHRTPGNLRAFYQCKMRNVKNGKNLENRFRSGEEIQTVRVDVKEMQYLYKEGDSLVCMDNETYDQVNIPEFMFGDAARFMKEGMTVMVQFEGDMPIGGTAPLNVELEITYTEPGIKGDTATNTGKPATLETGAEIRVPLFCEIGELIRVNTQNGEYVERVKK